MYYIRHASGLKIDFNYCAKMDGFLKQSPYVCIQNMHIQDFTITPYSVFQCLPT